MWFKDLGDLSGASCPLAICHRWWGTRRQNQSVYILQLRFIKSASKLLRLQRIRTQLSFLAPSIVITLAAQARRD